MRLDRKPAVGSGDENGPAHPQELGDEPHLIFRWAGVLDDGIRVNDVERLVGKRQLPSVGTSLSESWLDIGTKKALDQAETCSVARTWAETQT